MGIDSETVDQVFSELYPEIAVAMQTAGAKAAEAGSDAGSIAIGVAWAIAAAISTTTVMASEPGDEAEQANNILEVVREKVGATDWPAWRDSMFPATH